MKKVLLILLWTPCLSFSQRVYKISEDSILNKWESAIVNIETITSLTDEHETARWIYHQSNDRQTRNHLWDSLSNIKLDDFGTAIYLIHNNHHFLVTARHVLYDNFSPDTNKIRMKILLVENDNDYILNRRQTPFINTKWIIFYPDNRLNLKTDSLQHIFSSNNDDLAILDIDSIYGGSEGQEFINTLNYRGYKPISITDIDTICKFIKGQAIYALGFPIESWQRLKDTNFIVKGFEPIITTLPIITQGVIGNVSNNKNYFYGNIFVYHGFSGGAIIRNNKLIGIISRADTIKKTSNNPELKYYLELNPLFIKASMLPDLIRKLEGRLYH